MVTLTKKEAKELGFDSNFICIFHETNPDQEAVTNSCEDCVYIQEPCGCGVDEGCEICERNAKAQVWCRDCGKEMKQYPFGQLAYSCKKCKLKAIVEYSKMPIVKAMSEVSGNSSHT